MATVDEGDLTTGVLGIFWVEHRRSLSRLPGALKVALGGPEIPSNFTEELTLFGEKREGEGRD